MRPREIASTLGFAKQYYYAYWRVAPRDTADITPIMRKTGAVFVHIPKAAGMSIYRTIYDRETGHGHAPAIGFRTKNRTEFESLFKFTIMRQPTDRFISAFYFLTTVPMLERDKAFAQRHLSNYENPNDLLTAARNSRRIRGEVLSWVHFTPQSWFFTDYSGKELVDYIGRVEEFDTHMAEIASRLGKTFFPQKVNKSKRPSDTPLDDANLALLHDYYGEDYALYEKHFGSA